MDRDKHRPMVVSFCSGKGGVGKSVLAANLAFLMSKKIKVTIWDADMNFPNQHLLFGVEPPVRVNDVYAGKVSVKSALFPVTKNLNILADMPAVVRSERFSTNVIQSVYESLINECDNDLIIIDTPAGGSYELLQCSAISDIISIVITDEPTSLLDAYGLIKMLTPYIKKNKIKLLVNNVIDNEDADEVSKKLNMATENFLNFELEYLGFVPYDRVVRQSIMRQELFVETEPESEVSKAVGLIADTIEESIQSLEYK